MLVENQIVKMPVRSARPHVERTGSGAGPVWIGRSGWVDSIAALLRDTTAEDRYWRFGNVGSESVKWLVERMRAEASRGAYVAKSSGRLIGLLDFVTIQEEIEFGVLVHSSRRRQGVASFLVRSFLGDVARSQPEARIVAYCDLENYVALRLLQTAGLRATLIDRDWTRFESIVPAPEL
jgi:RimJ/RimL family protein N-acetyltransferase